MNRNTFWHLLDILPSFFFFGCQKATKFRGCYVLRKVIFIRPCFSYVRMISPAVELYYSSDTHFFRLKKGTVEKDVWYTSLLVSQWMIFRWWHWLRDCVVPVYSAFLLSFSFSIPFPFRRRRRLLDLEFGDFIWFRRYSDNTSVGGLYDSVGAPSQ